MTKEIPPPVAAWIALLESGEIKQRTGVLNDGDGMCCLGVASECHRREVGTHEWRKIVIDNKGTDATPAHCFAYLPVGADLADFINPEDGLPHFEDDDTKFEGQRIAAYAFLLPPVVGEWLGGIGNNPIIKMDGTEQRQLNATEANDSDGLPFPTIARMIRERGLTPGNIDE